jgi:hypothetical protein
MCFALHLCIITFPLNLLSCIFGSVYLCIITYHTPILPHTAHCTLYTKSCVQCAPAPLPKAYRHKPVQSKHDSSSTCGNLLRCQPITPSICACVHVCRAISLFALHLPSLFLNATWQIKCGMTVEVCNSCMCSAGGDCCPHDPSNSCWRRRGNLI